MNLRHLAILATAPVLALTGCAPSSSQVASAGGTPGFEQLFDGKTLAGWTGDTTIWSVRDGAITGGSETHIPKNTFLISDGQFSDFELHYRYRINGSGNSGVQFRSYVSDPANFIVKGLQANVVPTDQAERFGMLWEEGGRGELALLGHRMIISRKDGKVVKTVPESVNPRETLFAAVRPYPEWNDVVVIAYGNHMLHALNGYLVYDAIDEDPASRREGILALQAHEGPPMFVQFKDIEIKRLAAPPVLDGRFITNPGPPTPADPGPRVAR